MDRNIANNIKEVFRTQAVKIKVFLKQTETVGSNFDPYRQIGKTVVKQNARFIKAIVRDVSPEKLIVKQLGLVTLKAKELLVHRNDINTLRICERIVIDNEDYVKYHNALGNQMAIWKKSHNYYRVIIFKKEDQP